MKAGLLPATLDILFGECALLGRPEQLVEVALTHISNTRALLNPGVEILAVEVG
jgi:hypothetical protein